MYKVLITTVPFGERDSLPLELLQNHNVDYLINPLNKRLTADELSEMVEDFDIIIAGTEPINSSVMASAKNLKMISRVGIGLDSVDLIEAERLGISVSYTPDAPAPAVIDLTMGLIYTLLRKVHISNVNLHKGIWHRYMGKRLSECTIGIIGAGRVGSQVIDNLQKLGCKKILYNDKKVRLNYKDQSAVFTDKEEIYKLSDLISFHVPLDLETNNMITIKEIKMMKQDVILINTARGGIINEKDLCLALQENLIDAAAIDVFKDEPYSGELTKYDNCILSAHMGSMTEDCRAQMEIEATEEVIRFIKGEDLKGRVPLDEYETQKHSYIK